MLCAASHVMPMIWIAFVSYVVVGVPVTYLMGFPLGLGTYGIIMSFSVSLFLAAALFLLFLPTLYTQGIRACLILFRPSGVQGLDFAEWQFAPRLSEVCAGHR